MKWTLQAVNSILRHVAEQLGYDQNEQLEVRVKDIVDVMKYGNRGNIGFYSHVAH